MQIYRRYSQIPYFELYQKTRSDFSVKRDLLPGAAAGLLTNYIDRSLFRLWYGDKSKLFARRRYALPTKDLQ